jgi:putative ABC transport system permease protein
MFKNYLLTAWRNIIKNGIFSAINILGLALGLMSCILITLLVVKKPAMTNGYLTLNV